MKNDFIKNKNNKPIPKKAKKMSVSQVITLLLMIFWTITSVLTIALTIKSCSQDTNNNNVAYAEEFKPYSETGDIVYNDYSFYGNDLFYLGAYRYNFQGSWTGVSFIKFSVNFTSTYDTTEEKYITRAYINSTSYLQIGVSVGGYVNTIPMTAYWGSYEELFENKDLANSIGKICNLQLGAEGDDNSYAYPFTYYMNGNFNSNVKFIQIGSTTNALEIFPREPNLPKPDNVVSNLRPYNIYTYIRYLDNNGNSITFAFPSSNNLTLNDRTYAVGEITDNEGYILGKQEGRQEGRQEGFAEGKQQGYEQGMTEGKALGKQEGIEDANTYTFFSLLSAVVDAPLNMFKQMFNFELLGYNISNLILSLFTLSIIIVIIKIFI